MRSFTSRAALRAALALCASVALPSLSHAQDSCGEGFVGCAEAPIEYHHREGLPVEFDVDTGWVPGGSPVSVRFRAALVGNTRVDLRGRLQGGWPEPIVLSAAGDPDGGNLSVDYGVQFTARARLSLPVDGAMVGWEGALPFIPMIDFRAMAAQMFDPWAWDGVSVAGRTMRVRVATISLTDSIIRIPGISGGFAFDAAGEVQADYRSTRLDFGIQADPITASVNRVQGVFTAGPFVEYSPVLEGVLGYTATIHVYPSLYVSLAGRRWNLDLADIPIRVPFSRTIRFDPSVARLGLPDIQADVREVDFGEVTLGDFAERSFTLRNMGEGAGRVVSTMGDGPFSLPSRSGPLPVASRSEVVVTFTPVRPGPVEGTVVVTTSDPDNPRVRVAVRGVGVEPPVVDAGVDAGPVVVADAGADDAGPEAGTVVEALQDGGCGCRAVGGGAGSRAGGAGGFFAALAGVWSARRPRRRSHGVARAQRGKR
ncbi:MAG: hypothetical protein R3A52_19540 [Polyangiales bacterium]